MRALLGGLLLVAISAAVSSASEPPPYLILRAPKRPPEPCATQGYYPGQAYGVETHAYNYGWFGAKPGKTAQRSFGYYRNYTQWKVR
jgi:hypothetical protein